MGFVGIFAINVIDPIAQRSASFVREKIGAHFKNIVAGLAHFEVHAVVDELLASNLNDRQRFGQQIPQAVFGVQIVVTNQNPAAPIDEQGVSNDFTMRDLARKCWRIDDGWVQKISAAAMAHGIARLVYAFAFQELGDAGEPVPVGLGDANVRGNPQAGALG